MGYRNVTPWLEVSWGMNNAPHGDDQTLVVSRDDMTALILADGVTTSTVGRCASALLAFHIGLAFDEQSRHLDRQRLEGVERFMRAVVLDAVKKTQEEMNTFSHHTVLNEPTEEGRPKETFESAIKALENMKEYWRRQYMTLDIDPNEGENTKALDSALTFLKEREQELTTPPLTSSSDEQPKADERLKEIIEQLPKGSNETDQAVIEHLLVGLSKQSPQDWDSTTTLCFALLFPEEQEDYKVTRMVTLSLGDSRVTILSPERLWVKHYEVKTPRVTTFISTKSGIMGTPDVASRVLYPDECVVMSSDGANILWTTPAGVEGVPFQNLIEERIDKEDSLEGFAESWLDYMLNRGALTDDASLIVARIVDDETYAE
jgi:hypothetical protein